MPDIELEYIWHFNLLCFAKATGIMYAPAFLFLMGIAFSLIMIFYLMIVVSNIQKKLTKLIQENSILKDRIEER